MEPGSPALEADSLPSEPPGKSPHCLQHSRGSGGGIDRELGISRYRLLYTGWLNNKVLLDSMGNYIQYPAINHNGREVKWSEVAQSCPTRPVRLFATPWTVAYQAPLSMGFSRQEYWSGLPFPSPGDLSDPGIKPGSPAFQADSLPSELPGKPISKPES